jgi:hypothetical protein
MSVVVSFEDMSVIVSFEDMSVVVSWLIAATKWPITYEATTDLINEAMTDLIKDIY